MKIRTLIAATGIAVASVTAAGAESINDQAAFAPSGQAVEAYGHNDSYGYTERDIRYLSAAPDRVQANPAGAPGWTGSPVWTGTPRVNGHFTGTSGYRTGADTFEVLDNLR